ncbi:MAG: hypothetical protein KF902_02420 [Phycisphaeraceae bacterium]|nr:hypothetical protein [Phycisphaeraceae bacterium]
MATSTANHSPAAPEPGAFSPLPSISDTLAARIIADLAEPQATLASVAEKHNIHIATLTLWLTTPRGVELLHALESGACRHVRLTASLHLSAAVETLLLILDNFKRLHATLDPADPILIRAANHARIAAYHLYRLSRITPLTDDQIAHAAARSAARRASRSSAGTTLQTGLEAPQTTPARRASHSSAGATLQTGLEAPQTAPARPSAPLSTSTPLPPAPTSPLPIFPAPTSPLPTPSHSSPRSSAALRVESSSPLRGESSPSRSSRPAPSPRRPIDLIRAASTAPIPLGSSP